jgi:hypothetical protein
MQHAAHPCESQHLSFPTARYFSTAARAPPRVRERAWRQAWGRWPAADVGRRARARPAWHDDVEGLLCLFGGARAGAQQKRTTSDHGSEDEEDFILNADDLRMFQDSIRFEIQSELIEGLGVQKLSRQCHQLAGCDEYRKTKMFPAVMDAITALAEDHRRCHQHTSMILVSSLTIIK